MQALDQPGRKTPQDAIVAWLRANANLSDEAVRDAEKTGRETGETALSLLPRLGLVTETDLARAYAACLGLDLVTATAFPKEPVLPDTLKKTFLTANKVLPLRVDGRVLHVAIADPLNYTTVNSLQFATHLQITAHVAEPRAIEDAIEQLYGTGGNRMSAIAQELTGGQTATNVARLDQLKDQTSDAPVIRFVNAMVDRAIDSRASDIHIEPFATGVRIRYRVDGMLRDVDAPPAESSAAIQSRIKIMAQLNIAQKRLPQDGRMRLAIRGRMLDFRVATTPTMFGEAIVIRVLDPKMSHLSEADLGFSPRALERYRELLTRPHGIVLVTGPTGSGKTTTLYAALNSLNQRDRKILTVEDPVEYMIEGVNQVNVSPDIGYGFAAALRSFLRQDPDVMMVGEIRDLETSEVAAQAALTGHLVLSTLHTNDAASAVTRLLDMGVEDFLIASTLNGVVAQRLVRRLCPKCRRVRQPDEIGSPKVQALIARLPRATFYVPNGCPACEGTGYFGRSAIAEVLLVTDELRRSFSRGHSAQAISEIARREGMTTMFEEGILLAAAGETSVEEIMRATLEI